MRGMEKLKCYINVLCVMFTILSSALERENIVIAIGVNMKFYAHPKYTLHL